MLPKNLPIVLIFCDICLHFSDERRRHYQMVSSVTTRRDVQPFSPHISQGAVCQAGELRELLLSKLINGK